MTSAVVTLRHFY